MASCGGVVVRPAAPPVDPSAIAWRYEVSGDPQALLVAADLVAGGADELRVDPDAAPFVHDVVYRVGQAWRPAEARDGAWVLPCHDHGCHLKYRFALREAAEKLDDAVTAIRSGDGVAAPPSTWLLHPAPVPGRLHLHVSLTPPALFAAGMKPARDGAASAFESSTGDLDDASFAVVGPLLEGTARSGSARVDVAMSPKGLALGRADVLAWVQTAVDSITAYLGRFPVARTLVIVQAGRPGSPTRGVTIGVGGPAVLIRAGDAVTPATTRDDWVITHELLHVVLPSLSREHVWLGEGIPTYVEPIVRARVGLITPEKFWEDLVEGLPQGLPEAGDEGLERTHTWGRTYWGGALFCLLADVTIRERTGGARSFDDVVRGLVATGGDVEQRWDITRLLAEGDRATGTTVLRDLYETLGEAPGPVDLPALFARLGVRSMAGHVTFDDAAPLASVRRGIAGR